jgi:hypothetical protein
MLLLCSCSTPQINTMSPAERGRPNASIAPLDSCVWVTACLGGHVRASIAACDGHDTRDAEFAARRSTGAFSS